MARHKYEVYDLGPRRKSFGRKLLGWVVDHPALVVYSVGAIILIVALAMFQANAQADYLMSYGSG
jgi:hypothetical protein